MHRRTFNAASRERLQGRMYCSRTGDHRLRATGAGLLTHRQHG